MTTVADLLASTLAEIGVRQIFGIVGDALNPFTDAIERQHELTWIGVRHEEGAALAAAGQAKLTGRLGVCCGTTGPGGTHLVAGLYEARKDHAPVLAITGDVEQAKAGTDGLQENSPDLLFRDVSVYTTTIATAEQAPAAIRAAIAAAYGERGVAHISVPPEVFKAKVSGQVPSLATLRPRPEVAPAPEDIAALADRIERAKSVTLMVGFGCRGAAAEVSALAGRLHAPVVHTYRALDLLPFEHPYNIGGIGLIGGRPGTDAVADADLLVMLGTDYPYTEFLPDHGRVVQVDERAQVLGRRAPVALGVVGSVRPALAMLLEHLPQRDDTKFLDRARKARETWVEMLSQKADPARAGKLVHPQAVARALSDAAADDAVHVSDTGEVTLWAGNWLRPKAEQRVVGSFNNAAVGTGLGMANGIAALDPARQVILHVGDGGMTMLLGEFMTAVEHKLPVKAVVYDNGGWGLVHFEMEGAGYPAAKGTGFTNPDFAAFARACGAHGFTVKEPGELLPAVTTFLATEGPAILHVLTDPAEIPAMPHIKPAQALRFGIAKVRELVGV
ncbi:MAG: pyruvate dehydrogenase [Sphingomonadaceae bacterium]|nr:pyruvate dehydrogenase [Sphingomonadaceae bacterium]